MTKAQAERNALVRVPGNVIHDKVKTKTPRVLLDQDPAEAPIKKVEVDEAGKI